MEYVRLTADNLMLSLNQRNSVPKSKSSSNPNNSEFREAQLSRIQSIVFQAIKQYLIPRDFYESLHPEIEYEFRIRSVSMGVNAPNMQRVSANAKIGSRNVGMCVMEMIPSPVSAVYPNSNTEIDDSVLMPDIAAFVPLQYLLEQRDASLLVGNSYRQEIADELARQLQAKTDTLVEEYDTTNQLLQRRNEELQNPNQEEETSVVSVAKNTERRLRSQLKKLRRTLQDE